MQLSLPVRIKIAHQFHIVKKGPTEVFDNQIKSDGYLIKDVEEALNIDAIQEYLGVQETDMMTLWMWLIDKIEGRELTQVNIDTTIKIEQEKERINEQLEDMDAQRKNNIITKPKRGRKPKAK